MTQTTTVIRSWRVYEQSLDSQESHLIPSKVFSRENDASWRALLSDFSPVAERARGGRRRRAPSGTRVLQRRCGVDEGLSGARSLASGVAQGCPLSPLLFLVVTEALTRAIARDENITGVKINSGSVGTVADEQRYTHRFQHIRTWSGQVLYAWTVR